MIKNKKVIAIILSFKREQNIPQVVEGLRKQSFIDDILVVHNYPSKTRIEGCYNIISDINFGCVIRHQIAFAFNEYDYFVFSDDDLACVDDLSDNVIDAVELAGDKSVIGIYGLKLDKHSKTPYSDGKNVHFKNDSITPVDIVKGRFHIISKNNIMRMSSSNFNTKFLKLEDDIRANLIVQKEHNLPSYVFRVKKGQVKDLSSSFALQDRPTHYSNRDFAILEASELGWMPCTV